MPYSFNPFTGSFDNTPTVSQSATDSQTLSFNESNKNLSISSGNTVSLSALVDSTGVDTEVRALTSNWESTYTTFKNLSSTFLTSETDSQTLSFNESTKNLSISNGNTVSLSSLVDLSAVDIEVRALTGNWQSTYTTVQDNSANWQGTYTIVQTNSAAWNAADEVLVAQVSNADSVTLNRGDVVYTFGATGDVMSVKLASNSAEATSSKTLGVINETIIPNGIGYVTVAGRIDKMSFPHPFADGDALWLGSTPGTFTRVKPYAPNHGVYLGVVERANNGNGIAYIKVQNGYELNEIHDVLITSVSANQILRRNNTNNLWVNTDDGDKWDSAYTTVQSNSAQWASNIDTGVRSLTSNWQSTYTTVQSNSATWNSKTTLSTVVDYLSTNNVILSSAQIGTGAASTTLYVRSQKIGINTESPNHALTVVGNISATGLFYGDGSQLTGIIAGDTEATTLVRSNSANWNLAPSVYTTVQTNSATNWNYQGTDLKALSANWQSTYTTVQTNSATWGSGGGGSNAYLPLSGGNLTGNVTTTAVISSTNVIYASGSRVVTGDFADTTPVYKIRALTQLEYNALGVYDDNTIYFIKQ
jgi:hypothetical protein